ARRGRLHRVLEVLRRTAPEIGIPPDAGGSPGALSLPRAHRGGHQGHSAIVSSTMNLHVAIIMDGNGRWAQHRGMPRSAGHVHGAKAVNGIVEAAARAGIRTLTLYAFSADNWGRPNLEVDA